jgi:dTDP-4-dehydrorhamnose 3,5-epimerase-like enzyme
MELIPATLPDLLLLKLKIFGGEHGFFFESFNEC